MTNHAPRRRRAAAATVTTVAFVAAALASLPSLHSGAAHARAAGETRVSLMQTKAKKQPARGAAVRVRSTLEKRGRAKVRVPVTRPAGNAGRQPVRVKVTVAVTSAGAKRRKVTKTVMVRRKRTVRMRVSVPAGRATWRIAAVSPSPQRGRIKIGKVRAHTSSTSTPPDAKPPTGPPTSPDPDMLEREICGVWVLQQVTSAGDLDRLRSKLDEALALPGVTGLSVRFPWDAADMTGTTTTTPILDKAKEIAEANGKRLSIRFMAGAHTPARVFEAGASSYANGSARSPLPWSNSTGSVDVFLAEYDKYAAKLAAWSRANDVSLLHMSWYGQDWAELNHGAELRAAEGYTYDKWLTGHKRLLDVAMEHASADLAVEAPLSGYGPLSGGQSAALADHVVSRMGANSSRFYVQANGWDETREWGAPDMNVEGQFDAIWAKPVKRGLQMIQPDGYDWSQVFDRLTQTGATYGEVYLPSFWQTPGPTPEFSNNTTERIAQLRDQVRLSRQELCR